MNGIDRQAILVLLTGDDEDSGFLTAAADLNAKATGRRLASSVVAATARDPATRLRELAGLSAESRLYVVGLTSADRTTVGGFTPEGLAFRLGDTGLTAVGKVSLVASGAALPVGYQASASGEPPHEALDGYAARLHRGLARIGVRCAVVARAGEVRVVGAGALPGQGRKLTRANASADWQHRPPRAKLTWLWVGEQQVVRWSDVAAPEPAVASSHG